MHAQRGDQRAETKRNAEQEDRAAERRSESHIGGAAAACCNSNSDILRLKAREDRRSDEGRDARSTGQANQRVEEPLSADDDDHHASRKGEQSEKERHVESVA
jgi:hypothetical protein